MATSTEKPWESVFDRWASLGLGVAGAIHPYEDPETLVSETLAVLGSDNGRLPGMLTSWLLRYGHLLLTKKLRFRTERERRLFSALVGESGTTEKKLLHMIQKPTRKEPEFLYGGIAALDEFARKDPLPSFLKQGFIIKRPGWAGTLVREKIVLPPAATFKRSKILRGRALYGANIRSDILTLLPTLPEMSLRELARRLHVSPPVVHHAIEDLKRSGLVESFGSGRTSQLRWLGKKILRVA